MLSRSFLNRFNRALFTSHRNDFDVFIEDTALSSKPFYREMFGRFSKFKIIDFHPMGGRNNVLDNCGANTDYTKNMLWIVDGDMYLLTEPKETLPPRLFRLDKYCIENYMINEEALLYYLNNEISTMYKDEISDKLCFKNFLDSMKSSLKDLILCYAVVFKLDPSLETVGYSICRLINKCSLNSALVQKRIDELYLDMISKHGPDTVKKTKAQIQRVIKTIYKDSIDHISGKDVLFPLIKAYCDSHYPVQCNPKKMKNQMSQKCNTKDFKRLNEFMMNIDRSRISGR